MASQTINKNIQSSILLDEPVQQVKQVKQVNANDNTLTGFQQEVEERFININEFPPLGTKESTLSALCSFTKQQKIFLKNETFTTQYIDPRTASFAVMADKTRIASSLTRTKACRLVTEPFISPKEGEEPRFGMCTRPYCSFAHSVEELQAPICGFDGNCRFINGKIDNKTRKKIPGSQCRFWHTHETVGEWLKRSGVERDPLPETNDLRQPRTMRIDTTFENIKHSISPVPPVPPVQQTQVRAETSKPEIRKPRKSRWDEKPEEKLVENKNVKKNGKKEKHYSSSDDENQSDSSESEYDSDSEYEKKKSSSKSTSYVIRVPTKELAEMAIKAAFDRGQYNLRIVVEE
jgi:hypothetical protein